MGRRGRGGRRGATSGYVDVREVRLTDCDAPKLRTGEPQRGFVDDGAGRRAVVDWVVVATEATCWWCWCWW